MKIVFSKSEMMQALSSVEIAVKDKVGFSNSSMIKLTAELDRISVEAYDGQISYATQINGSVEKEGGIRLPRSKFASFVGNMPDGDIAFSCDEEAKGHLNPSKSQRKIKTTINGLSGDDFSPLPSIDSKENFINLEKSHLKKMIAHVSFAVASEATRYTLNGVLLDVKKNHFSMVASDGRRLAVYQALLPDVVLEDFRTIIPSGFANQLEKQLSGDGPVQIFSEKERNMIFFCFDGEKTLVSCREVDGASYPEYKDFIPKNTKFLFSVDRRSLLDALSIGSSIYDNMSVSRVIFGIKPMELEIKTSDKSYGDVEETLAIDGYEGDVLEMGFNCEMLKTIVSKIQSDKIVFYFDSNEEPVLIKDSSNLDYEYVLMPMRLQQSN